MERNSRYTDEIKRGSIFHSTIFETIDHGKFFVIIGENKNEYVGFFYINSNIHRWILNKQQLLDLQYYVKQSQYAFLRYDSFLNCSSLTVIDKKTLKQSIVDGKTEYKGRLSDEDLDNILTIIRQSKLYTKEEKDTFFK